MRIASSPGTLACAAIKARVVGALIHSLPPPPPLSSSTYSHCALPAPYLALRPLVGGAPLNARGHAEPRHIGDRVPPVFFLATRTRLSSRGHRSCSPCRALLESR